VLPHGVPIADAEKCSQMVFVPNDGRVFSLSSQLNFFGIIHAQVNLLFALQDRVCFRFSHDGNICDVVCFCLVAK